MKITMQQNGIYFDKEKIANFSISKINGYYLLNNGRNTTTITLDTKSLVGFKQTIIAQGNYQFTGTKKQLDELLSFVDANEKNEAVGNLTEDDIKQFNDRLQMLREEPIGMPEITTFTEIKVSEEQLGIMAKPMFGWDKDFLLEYYKGKIHGNLLFTGSPCTTREDVPDFQYLFDLGIQALNSGMELDES